ncbi:MAG: hypothetical protein ACQESR_19330, partial [Planctomycetota bacterium]
FREIRGHQIKYDFALEKTGLETRPTYTFCNVRVQFPHCKTGRSFRITMVVSRSLNGRFVFVAFSSEPQTVHFI